MNANVASCLLDFDRQLFANTLAIIKQCQGCYSDSFWPKWTKAVLNTRLFGPVKSNMFSVLFVRLLFQLSPARVAVVRLSGVDSFVSVIHSASTTTPVAMTTCDTVVKETSETITTRPYIATHTQNGV